MLATSTRLTGVLLLWLTVVASLHVLPSPRVRGHLALRSEAEAEAGRLDKAATRARLFQEVLNRSLHTLSVATGCTRALVYLQSERENMLEAVCHYPSYREVLPVEAFVPLECLLPTDARDDPRLDCLPTTGVSGAIVRDYSIIDQPDKDNYGLLRVEYSSETWICGVGGVDRVAESVANVIAVSIRLERMHFEREEELLTRVAELGDDDQGGDQYGRGFSAGGDSSKSFNEALISNIWNTASNSIKTMRTMLKMLERRNAKEWDEIGKETYENIHVQLESLGVSISPLMPSASVYVALEEEEEEEEEDDEEDEEEDKRDNTIAGTDLVLRGDLWAPTKEESSIDYTDEGVN